MPEVSIIDMTSQLGFNLLVIFFKLKSLNLNHVNDL